MTGYSLISKAGKNSFNRFKILGERPEILGHSSKKKPIKKKSEKIAKKITVLELLKQSIGNKKPTSKKEENKVKTDRSSPVSSPKTLSRVISEPAEHFNLRELYSPSYKAQDKHIPTIKFKTSITIGRKPQDRQIKLHNHSPVPIKNSYSDVYKNGISFEKQLSRDFIWMQHNLSEKRFEYSPLPEPVKLTPIFDKQTSRVSINKSNENFPDYHPQKEKFLKKISKDINFDKYLNRKETKKKFLPDFYDVKFSYIDPKPKYCKFR